MENVRRLIVRGNTLTVRGNDMHMSVHVKQEKENIAHIIIESGNFKTDGTLVAEGQNHWRVAVEEDNAYLEYEPTN